MEQEYVIPIAIKADKEYVVVRFFDFELQEQRYENGVDYIAESKILLSKVLMEYERKKITIPPPKKIETIKLDKDEKVIFLDIWLPFYRTENEKYVKKTLTIPYWIDELAKKQNLNFSQILKEALLENLGLCDEVKKRKIYKFLKPMNKLEDFLFMANKLINSNIQEERSVFLLAANTKDFNLIINIWVMWVNKKTLDFFINHKKEYEKEFNKKEWLKQVEGFKAELISNANKRCGEIINELKKYNIEQSSLNDFDGYVKLFTKWLLNASLKYNGIFERNESIYDCMRLITDISMLKKNIEDKYHEEYIYCNKFTLKYEIEIPYLYVLAWNIEALYTNERIGVLSKEQERNIKNICYECLMHVSKTTLEILVENPIFSARLDKTTLASTIKSEQEVPLINQLGSVDFSRYLPSLSCSKERIKEYIGIKNKIVAKEVLKKIPMTPLDIYDGDKMGIKYLVHSLCSEIQK